MDPYADDEHNELVQRLTIGFGALLDQAHELARKNLDLEQRLALARDEVWYLVHLHVIPPAVTIQISSRPVATAVALMITY